jgi:hypothetical protein
MDVEIYSMGPLCCSVCAPADMPREEVERAVNQQHPAGTEHCWRVADDKTFSDGTTKNGGIVDCHRGHTRHWLLDC